MLKYSSRLWRRRTRPTSPWSSYRVSLPSAFLRRRTFSLRPSLYLPLLPRSSFFIFISFFSVLIFSSGCLKAHFSFEERRPHRRAVVEVASILAQAQRQAIASLCSKSHSAAHARPRFVLFIRIRCLLAVLTSRFKNIQGEQARTAS
jgi:hypothetical protein